MRSATRLLTLASLVLVACGASERGTNGSGHNAGARSGAGAGGIAGGDAGRGASADTGSGVGGASGSGATGGGAVTAGASPTAGAPAGGSGGTAATDAGRSGAGASAVLGGSAGMLTGEGGSEAGEPGTTVDPSAWDEWAVTPMPNAPGSDLPNIQKYTVGVDTVHDDVTGLTWQRKLQSDLRDPTEAKPYCEGLELDGKRGFRVPRIIELVTLIDYLRDDHAADDSVFDLGVGRIVVSATKTLYSTVPLYFVLDFWAGEVTDQAQATGTLCVSGGPVGELPEHYTVGADAVVDHWTGLTWSALPRTDSLEYDDAVAYCASLDAGGSSFRLPSLNELLTLWDFSEIPAVITKNVVDFEDYGPGIWLAPTPRVAEGKPMRLTGRAQVFGNNLQTFGNVICVH